MKKAVPMIVSEENFKEIFAFADQYSKLAKALYNAALFRIRQVFTGWDKGENRTPNDGKGCLLKLPKIEKSRIPLSYLKDTSNLRDDPKCAIRTRPVRQVERIWIYVFQRFHSLMDRGLREQSFVCTISAGSFVCVRKAKVIRHQKLHKHRYRLLM